MLGVCAALVLTVVVPVIINVVSTEVTGWLPYLSATIVRRAARRLPAAIQERYVGEWLAELAQLDDRRLYGVVWAWSIRRSVTQIRAAYASAHTDEVRHTCEVLTELERRIVRHTRMAVLWTIAAFVVSFWSNVPLIMALALGSSMLSSLSFMASVIALEEQAAVRRRALDELLAVEL